MTKTKIVCTIGPACWDRETLSEMIRRGMDVARLNFSHGDHDTHRQTFARIREVSKEMETSVAIMQDLCGPKIRLGKLPDQGISLEEGSTVALTGQVVESTRELLHVSYEALARDLKPEEPVLIDDGMVQLKVDHVKEDQVVCKVMIGGTITSHKGVNLPDSALSISAITDKDRDDVKLGMELGVDFIALSFVRRPSDIRELKSILEEQDKFIPIIAKIEKQEAVNNLEEILTAADGAMVARGDLGIETPIEKVPLIQKEIIRRLQPDEQAGYHRHSDAGFHDPQPDTHPGRGHRHCQRNPGRHRRGNAFRRDRLGEIPPGGHSHHGQDMQIHRGYDGIVPPTPATLPITTWWTLFQRQPARFQKIFPPRGSWC